MYKLYFAKMAARYKYYTGYRHFRYHNGLFVFLILFTFLVPGKLRVIGKLVYISTKLIRFA